MKTRVISAALVAGVTLAAAPAAFAQVAGIGYTDPQQVVGSSNALKAAIAQIQITYKAQIDQYNTRNAQLVAQLKPLRAKIVADNQAGNVPAATIQGEVAQFQQLGQSGEKELQQIAQPFELARQYAIEQISDKLEVATQAVMTKRRVSLVLGRPAVLKADPSYNMDPDIIAEINLMVPTVSVTPPAGWLPRQQREEAAQQQAAAAQEAAQAGATPAPKKQPQGR